MGEKRVGSADDMTLTLANKSSGKKTSPPSATLFATNPIWYFYVSHSVQYFRFTLSTTRCTKWNTV